MADFSVGDTVIALCNFKTKSGNEIIKGDPYTIQGIMTCSCGAIMVDIGSNLKPNRYIKCECQEKFPKGIWWINSKRFTKPEVDESTEDVNAFMDIFMKQPVDTNR